MGQYFRTYVVEESGKEHFLARKVIGTEYVSAKLMDHSWVGNVWSEAVTDTFLRNGKKSRIFWIGDYYNDAVVKMECSNGKEKYLSLTNKYPNLKNAYDKNNTDILSATQNQCNSGYLLNYDTKQFLDIEKYCNLSNNDDEYIIHPVPLLTACGNGLGSGDYYEEYPNYDLVGCWAGDLLSLVESKDLVPADFEKFNIFFKEGGDM